VEIRVSRESLNKAKGAVASPFFNEEQLKNIGQNAELNRLLTEILTKKEEKDGKNEK